MLIRWLLQWNRENVIPVSLSVAVENGINMTLNKHQGVRAALCWNRYTYSDANVLVMPGRFISTEEADMILTEFFSTKFDGGRHQNRIDKIPVK